MAVSVANPVVFLDVAIGRQPVGRLEVELYMDTVPRTAENFRLLCTGRKGVTASGKPLHFKGTPVHSVIPGMMCEAGDVTDGNGRGGTSIWGAPFADESFAGKAGRHTGLGCVTMANRGPNTNTSLFHILFADAPWLDGKHVVVGRVHPRCNAVLYAIEAVGTRSGVPLQPVTIADCGELSGP